MSYHASQEIYEQVITLIKAAGARLLTQAGQIPDLKQGKLWVTAEDIKIERDLSALILSSNPDAKIFAEEEHDMFEQAEEIWIIDPISSTFSFLHGLPNYSIIVSQMIGGKLKFAAIFAPALNELFTAEHGKGAFLNGEPIHVNSNWDDPAFLYDPKPYGDHTLDKNLKIFTSLMELGTVRTYGSMGLLYAYVACGRIQAGVATTWDSFPEFAGQLIVEEAGGVFTNFAGAPFSFQDRSFIAAAGPKIHEIIRSKIT